MDYSTYKFSVKEYIQYFLFSAALAGLIGWLFYNSAWGLILMGPLYPLVLKNRREVLLEKRANELATQFRDSISAVGAALNAGYSIENAWKEALIEIKGLHGEKSIMAKELGILVGRLSMNEPIEDILTDFANRSGSEDIMNFCEVFIFAKRGGGDFLGIIRASSVRIARKNELLRTLTTDLASRRLEGRVMSIMPLGILLYMTITSPGYFDVLYHNTTGIIVMSVCLVGYAGVFMLSEKMLKIRVEV